MRVTSVLIEVQVAETGQSPFSSTKDLCIELVDRLVQADRAVLVEARVIDTLEVLDTNQDDVFEPGIGPDILDDVMFLEQLAQRSRQESNNIIQFPDNHEVPERNYGVDYANRNRA
jgi:hypothetical protein